MARDCRKETQAVMDILEEESLLTGKPQDFNKFVEQVQQRMIENKGDSRLAAESVSPYNDSVQMHALKRNRLVQSVLNSENPAQALISMIVDTNYSGHRFHKSGQSLERLQNSMTAQFKADLLKTLNDADLTTKQFSRTLEDLEMMDDFVMALYGQGTDPRITEVAQKLTQLIENINSMYPEAKVQLSPKTNSIQIDKMVSEIGEIEAEKFFIQNYVNGKELYAQYKTYGHILDNSDMETTGPEALIAINSKLSDTNMLGNILASFDRAAKRVAITEDWGDDPFRMLTEVINDTGLTGVAPQATAYMNNVLSGTYIPIKNNRFTRATALANKWTSAALLETAGALTLMDRPLIVKTAREFGMGRAQALRAAADITPRTTAERNMAANFGVAIDAAFEEAFNGLSNNRWVQADAMPGQGKVYAALDKTATQAFRLYGIAALSRYNQTKAVNLIAKGTHDSIIDGTPFNELDQMVRVDYARSGIGENEWNALLNLRDQIAVDGTFDINLLRNVDTELHMKFYSHARRMTDRSVFQPGLADELVVRFLKLDPQSPFYHMAKLTTKFINYSIFAMRNIYGRFNHLLAAKSVEGDEKTKTQRLTDIGLYMAHQARALAYLTAGAYLAVNAKALVAQAPWLIMGDERKQRKAIEAIYSAFTLDDQKTRMAMLRYVEPGGILFWPVLEALTLDDEVMELMGGKVYHGSTTEALAGPFGNISIGIIKKATKYITDDTDGIDVVDEITTLIPGRDIPFIKQAYEWGIEEFK